MISHDNRNKPNQVKTKKHFRELVCITLISKKILWNILNF